MEEIIIFTPKQFRDIVNYNLSKGATIAVASILLGFAFSETAKWMYGKQMHIQKTDYIPYVMNKEYDSHGQKIVRV